MINKLKRTLERLARKYLMKSTNDFQISDEKLFLADNICEKKDIKS